MLNCRTSAGSRCSSRLHPQNVPRTKPEQGQEAVLTLHLRHRHRKHPLCLCGCQRHDPHSEPQGLQSGVKINTENNLKKKKRKKYTTVKQQKFSNFSGSYRHFFIIIIISNQSDQTQPARIQD